MTKNKRKVLTFLSTPVAHFTERTMDFVQRDCNRHATGSPQLPADSNYSMSLTDWCEFVSLLIM